MASRDGGGSEYWKWSGLGFEFAGAVLVFTYLGYLADRRWGWEPWGMIAGVAVGLAGGLYRLAKEGFRTFRGTERSREGKQEDGEGAPPRDER